MFSEEPELQICIKCGLEKDLFEFPLVVPYCISCSRARQRETPELSRMRVDRRRAIQAGVYIEEVDRLVVFQRDNGMCHLCQLPVDPDNWHLEHKVPISKGGLHCYSNVGVSHPDCNWHKGGR